MNTFNETTVIELVAVQPVKIHDSLYYQLAFRVEGEETLNQLRINPEAFYPNPRPGDRVAVNWILGQIMGAEKLESVSG